MFDEQRPLDPMFDEHRPLDLMFDEHRPLDLMFDEQRQLDLMFDVQRPLDLMFFSFSGIRSSQRYIFYPIPCGLNNEYHISFWGDYLLA
ncbi:hypothetical protein DPMN_028638 [Dreissena polymorpha]|uniref:Uncharacterized protein n=1 Tax=Dreissena polymorpha TaxID=45954 RepID=A0A9D4LV26_DREPO|nr:hypothetical protein DPMN_028638 [Dreissena polymorpha]